MGGQRDYGGGLRRAVGDCARLAGGWGMVGGWRGCAGLQGATGGCAVLRVGEWAELWGRLQPPTHHVHEANCRVTLRTHRSMREKHRSRWRNLDGKKSNARPS